MAHSSFIDCDESNILSENFISAVKVELESPQVNDDENVAVEALGQLSSYETVTSTVQIKREEEFTIVDDVGITDCVIQDVTTIENFEEDNIFDFPFSCNICGLKLKYEVLLDEHKRFTHPLVDRPYECHSCGLTFQRKSSLKNHSKIHSYRTTEVTLGNNSITLDSNVKNGGIECNGNKLEASCQKTKSEEPADRIPPFETLKPSINTVSKNFQLDGNVTAFEDWSLVQQENANVSIDNNILNQHFQEETDVQHTETVISSPEFSNIATVDHSDLSKGENLVPPENNVKHRPYTCPFCNRTFAREKALFNHIRIHNDNYEKIVVESGYDMNHISNENIREEIVTQQRINTMPVYNSTNSPIKTNTGVTENDSKSKPYTCPFCNRTFAREKALFNHIRIHNENYDVTLECQKCHDVFDDIISLQAHLAICVLPESPEQVYTPEYYELDTKKIKPNPNGVGNHECHVCQKRFKTRQKVFRHMWVHRKKLHSCEVCRLTFPSIQYLDEHRLALHPSTAPFSCDKCGKSFMSKQGLMEHSRLHKGWSGQYFCSHCDKYFSSRQGFTIHGRIHTGERPYGCKYCQKSFRDGGTLKKHERIHTGERPHECPICHKRYNQKVVLREHIRGVHVMKRNSDINGKCPVCDATNMDKDEMSEHIVKHSDELVSSIKKQFNSYNYNAARHEKGAGAKSDKRKRTTFLKRKTTKNKDELITPQDEINTRAEPNNQNSRLNYKPVLGRPPSKNKPVQKQQKKDTSNNSNGPVNVGKITKRTGKKRLNVKVEVKRGRKPKGITSKSASNNSSRGELTKPVVNARNFEIPDETCSENSSAHFESEYENSYGYGGSSMNPNSDKTVECEMCHAQFMTRNELITHVLVHI